MTTVTTGEASALATLREFDASDRDYTAIAAIERAVLPDYWRNAEQYRYDDSTFDTSKYALKRYVAEDPETREIIAWSEYRHSVSYHDPDRYNIWIEVRPDRQKRGLGSLLLTRLEADLALRAAKRASTGASEMHPDSISFVMHRGFVESERGWESRLNPQEFEAERFTGYLRRVAKLGIEIAPLSELETADPDWLRKVYELNVETLADQPSPYRYTAESLESFEARTLGDRWIPHDSFLVARLGDEYVGLTYVSLNPDNPATVYQDLTGVRRAHRGKGIALALKVEGLKRARERGYTVMITTNSTLNAPMLAVNERLGFKRMPAWVEFDKDLGRASDQGNRPASG